MCGQKKEFIEQVKLQLGKMSQQEKEQWIIDQAKRLREEEEPGFLRSLSGEMRVCSMPGLDDIKKFCERVRAGEIYMEYEAHYYEFDENGRYFDGWKVRHNDPFHAMDFLDRVFKGCHDLMMLGEFRTAAAVFEQVCRLRFAVVKAPDSDRFMDDDSLFTLKDAEREGILSKDISDIGMDWVDAVIHSEKLCLNRGEFLAYADILDRFEY